MMGGNAANQGARNGVICIGCVCYKFAVRWRSIGAPQGQTERSKSPQYTTTA